MQSNIQFKLKCVQINNSLSWTYMAYFIKHKIMNATLHKQICFQACIEKADAILFIFSFTDHASFVEMPQQMGKIMKLTENPTSLAIGTR